MAHMISTPFGQAEVKFGVYGNGALAVQLISEDGEPIGKLSVNLVEEAASLGEREFFAKTWSENEPLIAPALASGIFEDTGRRVRAGFCEAQVWKVIG